jgi:hypothetical protein
MKANEKPDAQLSREMSFFAAKYNFRAMPGSKQKHTPITS